MSEQYPEIVKEAYIDAFMMWLVRDPEDLDVVVLPNMFGDIARSSIGAARRWAWQFSKSWDHHDVRTVDGSAPSTQGI